MGATSGKWALGFQKRAFGHFPPLFATFGAFGTLKVVEAFADVA